MTTTTKPSPVHGSRPGQAVPVEPPQPGHRRRFRVRPHRQKAPVLDRYPGHPRRHGHHLRPDLRQQHLHVRVRAGPEERVAELHLHGRLRNHPRSDRDGHGRDESHRPGHRTKRCKGRDVRCVLRLPGEPGHRHRQGLRSRQGRVRQQHLRGGRQAAPGRRSANHHQLPRAHGCRGR